MKQMQFQRKALPTQLELLLLLLLSIPSPVAAAQQHLLTACMMHVPRRRQAQFQLQPPPCSSLLLPARMLHLYGRFVCLFAAATAAVPPLSSPRLPVSASSRLHLRLSPSLSLILLSVCCLHCLLIRPLDGAALFVCFLKLQSFYTLHHGKHDPYF